MKILTHHRFSITVGMVLLALGATYLFLGILQVNLVFTHFYYIPTIFAALWFQRKGLAVPLLITGFLVLNQVLKADFSLLWTDLLRGGSLISVGLVVALLSERIARSESTLRATRDRYRTIFENTGNATIVVKDDKVIRLANSKFEKLSGYPKTALEGKKVWREFFSPKFLPMMDQFHEERRKNPLLAPQVYSSLFVARSGKTLAVEMTVDTIAGTGESVVSIRDVTEVEKSRALRQKVRRARRILGDFSRLAVRSEKETELLRDICRVVVETGGYRFAWVGMVSGDGRQRIEPVGWWGEESGYLKHLDINLTDTDPGAPMIKAIQSKKPQIVQDIGADAGMASWRRNADQRNYRAMASLPLVSRGESIGAMNIYAGEKDAFFLEESMLLIQLAGDLSARIDALRSWAENKRAEEAVRESEAKLKGIIRAVPHAMVILDRDRAVAWANPIGRDRFANGPCGNGACRVLSEGRKGNACLVAQCFQDGQVHQAEVGLAMAGGQMTAHWCTAVPASRDSNGAVRTVLLVMENISKRKKLQAEAARNSHLASLGELAAGVAHEINNPVNGIINYAQILIDQNTGEEGSAEIPQRICREGERVAEIVKNLLSFARSQGEGRSQAAVTAILSNTLSLVRAQLQKDGIQLRVDVPSALPLIHVRGQQIQQVLLNLISNARYSLNRRFPGASPEKRLEIRAKAIPGDRIRLTVLDKGMGIAPDILDQLCNPFFTTKPTGEGTGLGLSISHGIVADHEGRIDFESVEGEYAKAIIELPTLTAKCAQSPKEKGR